MSAGTSRLEPVQESMRWYPLAYSNYGLQAKLEIPVRVAGMQEGSMVAFNGVTGVRIASGDDHIERAEIRPNPAWTAEATEQKLLIGIEPGFAVRNQQRPVDIDIQAELTIYSPAQYHSLSIHDDAFVPGIGRCRSAAEGILLIHCQSVLRLNTKIQGYWAKSLPNEQSLRVLAGEEDRSPVPLTPTLHPITSMVGGFGAKSSYEGRDIVIAARKPVAYIQRRIELRGIRLSDYVR